MICLKETLSERGRSLKIKIKEGSEVHEYLDYAGFCNQFNIPGFPSFKEKTLEGSVLKLEEHQESLGISQKARELVDFLKAKQDMCQIVEAEIIASIEEILNNILQHSQASKYFLLSQAYPKSKRIRFVFYDNGIGIKNHIIKNDYQSMHPLFKKEVSEKKFEEIKNEPANLAIKIASRKHISATNYKENSGAGINYLIEDLLPVSNGKMCILSEDGIVTWGDNNKKICDDSLKYSIKGTLVSLTLDCDSRTKIIKNE